jgi:hypothetical protein
MTPPVSVSLLSESLPRVCPDESHNSSLPYDQMRESQIACHMSYMSYIWLITYIQINIWQVFNPITNHSFDMGHDMNECLSSLSSLKGHVLLHVNNTTSHVQIRHVWHIPTPRRLMMARFCPMMGYQGSTLPRCASLTEHIHHTIGVLRVLLHPHMRCYGRTIILVMLTVS